MDVTTAIFLIIVFLIVIAMVDLNRKHRNNESKSDRLFKNVQTALEQLVQERAFEKEKARLEEEQLKINVREALSELPATPQIETSIYDQNIESTEPHEDLDGRYEQAREHEGDSDGFLSAIRGQKYIVDFKDIIYFPCLDKEHLPVSYRLNEEVVGAIRKVYNLPDDNSVLLDYDVVSNFMKLNDISIAISYPKGMEDRPMIDKNTIIIPSLTPEERHVQVGNSLVAAVDGVDSNRRLIRYRDNSEVVFKECGNMELYKSYIRKFGNLGMAELDKFPDGDQFVAWYNEAIDEFAKLNEVQKFGNGV